MSDSWGSAARALREVFGFAGFRPGQEAAIRAILEGHDALVVMPTGGGKSLCFQLPALVRDGLTVVVSPLIALMKDQVDALVARGVKAAAINSTLSETEMSARLDAMAAGEYRLVYIAPERFRSDRFVRALSRVRVALFALDEAHCISQWGHDFRPDYLRIRDGLAPLGSPQVVALTATATPDVRADIVAQLGLGAGGRAAPRVFVSGFARPNLRLGVRRVGGREDKLAFILDAIARHGAGIVYCATRRNVESVAGDLGGGVIAYHGGMDDKERRAAQERFAGAERPVVVATNAFGMGIDRPDLRFVIHHDIPGSLEAYYQEAGRAGRDGAPAVCDLLHNPADLRTQEFFLDGANPTPDTIRATYALLAARCARGAADVAPRDLAARMPDKTSDMAVATAIVLLERAGTIRRLYDGGGFRPDIEVIRPVVPASNLRIDFVALAGKRRRDEQRLARMAAYAAPGRCRHRFILDYFGDTSAGRDCSACDTCGASGISKTATAAARPRMVTLPMRRAATASPAAATVASPARMRVPCSLFSASKREA
ncbi:MAG: RecQ family ATP-dependent DNA helicase [Lentisphaerae bacterium]|nr:RecQ family ATP-dependent DNA helicase [Lentisphaerota bacterium]